MNIHLVSIFPDIFESFLATSLIQKAQDRWHLEFSFHDPRNFCTDKHRQVDDEIYGGGDGMLLKAPPVIAAIKDIITSYQLLNKKFAIVMVTPSPTVFNQRIAHHASQQYDHIIFLCGRYEGFDHRITLRCQQHYPQHFVQWSLWQFVTLGGEVPTMVMIEAIVRLIPGVIGEENSRIDESYNLEKWMNNLEYPQYTRPQEVEWMTVPDVLLSGHHKNIEQWKNDMSQKL